MDESAYDRGKQDGAQWRAHGRVDAELPPSPFADGRGKQTSLRAKSYIAGWNVGCPLHKRALRVRLVYNGGR